ncbi:hypothetical protein MNBD_UNCLBAC01-1109 [hydrothermal vent metagenome]|uniref:DUF192 domain-containing protein n=1 Tax=hydrothermal vent metagenome TaxID=652676 RepID=A0A3B1DII9_9ZZZZ
MIKNFLIIFLVFMSLSCLPQTQVHNQICFNDTCIDIELAQTPEEHSRGLQGRKFLKNNEGMLFIFSDSQYRSFWMKDTFISLDILWLDEELRILHIEQNVQPCQSDPCPIYGPPYKAKYVLEINAAEAERLGFQLGLQASLK